MASNQFRTQTRAQLRDLESAERQQTRVSNQLAMQIKAAVAKGDTATAKILAKEYQRSQSQLTRIKTMKGRITGMQYRVQSAQSTATMAHALSGATHVLQQTNQSMNMDEIRQTTRQLMRETDIAASKEDMLDDAFAALDEPGLEEAADQQVDKVLTEILGDQFDRVGSVGTKTPQKTQQTAVITDEDVEAFIRQQTAA